MEALLLHEYAPHATAVGLLAGLYAILKCVKKTCLVCVMLSGWVAAAVTIFAARHSLIPPAPEK